MEDLLVYFVVGGDPEYVEMLQFAINTIRSFPDNRNIDLVVICEENYLPNLDRLRGAHLVTFDFSKKRRHPSLSKVDVFSVLDLRKYQKVLYLDCDIVVCGSLLPLFDRISREDCLYVVPEQKDQRMHESPFYSRLDMPYSEGEKIKFAQEGIMPFNAGQFGFRPTTFIESLFSEVCCGLNAYDPSIHLLEQSFMNVVFNKRSAVCYELKEFVSVLSMKHREASGSVNIVNHFVDVTYGWRDKLARMRAKWQDCFCHFPVSAVSGRAQLNELAQLPADPRIIEIGTFRGEFAEKLLAMYSPTKLVLIDPFDGPMCSGDADGNNVEWFDGASNHRLVLDKFGHLPNVKVIKARSCEVEFPRGEPSYDLVYVDGDHSAAGVAFDLEWALRRMKSGGYICGHDYSVNPAKTHNRYNFGVKEAVDKFCAQHGFRISGIMMDGCVGYVIQVS